MNEEEMKLLKNICTYECNECRWIDENRFCVWINYELVGNFVEKLKRIMYFDSYLSVLDAQIQEYGVCIELTARLFDKDELEEIFPKDKYK